MHALGSGWPALPSALLFAESRHAPSRFIVLPPQGPWRNTVHSGEHQIKMCAIRAVIKFNRQFIRSGGRRGGEGRRGAPTAGSHFAKGYPSGKKDIGPAQPV